MPTSSSLPENLSGYAVLVIDMWDKHWCVSASGRVGELASAVNNAVCAARDRGAQIIHAPTDTMSYYTEHHSFARARARNAPKANYPSLGGEHFGRGWWDQSVPLVLPSGGCPDHPICAVNAGAWTKQIATVKIIEAEKEKDQKDVVSESRDEMFNVVSMTQCKSIILLGVHLNMCVLWTRSFSLMFWLHLKKHGVMDNVYFVRDLTDTMYSPEHPPYLNHFAATDVMTRFITDNYAGSTAILSTELTGSDPFRFPADQRKTLPWKTVQLQYPADLSGTAQWLKANGNSVQFVDDQAHATTWELELLGPRLYLLTTAGNGVGGKLYLDGAPDTRSVRLQNTTVGYSGTCWYINAANANDEKIVRLHCCGPNGNNNYLYRYRDTGEVKMQSIPAVQAQKLTTLESELNWKVQAISP